MKIAVSFIKSRLSEKETIDLINMTDADYLHVDIMDGIFVENKNYDYEDIKLFLNDNKKLLDIHLMCNNPIDYINKYLELNPDCITFHIESNSNVKELIDYIHCNGVRCGLAINPETDPKLLLPYLNMIDRVLVMSVHPGKGGQNFIANSKSLINTLSLYKGNYEIEVDGGINNETIGLVKNADIVVSGSYICMSDNYQNMINSLRSV